VRALDDDLYGLCLDDFRFICVSSKQAVDGHVPCRMECKVQVV